MTYLNGISFNWSKHWKEKSNNQARLGHMEREKERTIRRNKRSGQEALHVDGMIIQSGRKKNGTQIV